LRSSSSAPTAREQDLSDTVDRLAASGVVDRVVSVLRVEATELAVAAPQEGDGDGTRLQGVLREYADRLGVTEASTVVTLGEEARR
jgi:hypothetical protein